MPPKRSTRASSVEDGASAPTRASRRLRSTQTDNASPLRALSPPRRKRNAKQTSEHSTSTLYTTSAEEATAQETRQPLPTPKYEVDTTAGVTETTYVPTWERVKLVNVYADQPVSGTTMAAAYQIKNQNMGAARRAFTRPISSHEFMTLFHRADSSTLSSNNTIRVVLQEVAHKLTDDEKVDIMIEQRAKIAAQNEDHQRIHRENVQLREKLTAQTTERQVLREQRRTSAVEKEQAILESRTNTPTPSNKRSAPMEEEGELHSGERPARRVKVAPSQSNGNNLERSLNEQYPLVSALAAANSTPPKKWPDFQEEKGGFHSFVAQRMRERERESAMINLDESDDDTEKDLSEEADAESHKDQHQPRTYQQPNHISSSSSTALTLTPITEETEPQTPTSISTPNRWGIRSLLAPVSRLFGGTPRTEPVRRHAPPHHGAGISAPTSTPSNTQTIPRRSSQGTITMNSSHSADEDEPATPTPNTGITAASFMPKSAPQNRTGPAPRRKTIHEKLIAQDAYQAKRKAAVEKAKQKAKEQEEKRKEAADRAEDDRLRNEALRLRMESIEAMQKTGEKRKIRVSDLEVIPNPAPGSFGMNEKYFEEDSDGEVYVEEDVSMMDAITPPPAKRVRFENSSPAPGASQKKAWWQENFNNVSPFKKTPPASLSSDPHRAQPYNGVMFADTRSGATHDGGNVFGQSESREAKKAFEENYMSPISYGKKYHVWTGPQSSPKERPANFNYSGHFVVPDDSDSDTELEPDESEPVPSPTPAQKVAAEKRLQSHETSRSAIKEVADAEATGDENGNKENEPEPRPNLFMKRSEQEQAKTSTEDGQAESTFTQQPPPTPTPAHAALPSTPGAAAAAATAAATAQSDSDALAKARLQAEKYKPKTPSGLRATSRLSPSPNITQGQKPIGATNDANLLTADTTATAATTSAGQAPSSQPSIAPVAIQFPIPTSEIPYEQTIQYAIDLANAIPEDQLPVDTTIWPPTTPAPWPLDPEVEAALKATEEHPDYEDYCDDLWKRMWGEYQREKAEGMHGGPGQSSVLV